MEKQVEYQQYINKNGRDMSEIRDGKREPTHE